MHKAPSMVQHELHKFDHVPKYGPNISHDEMDLMTTHAQWRLNKLQIHQIIQIVFTLKSTIKSTIYKR